MNHPSLPDHPDHDLYKRYYPNGGGSIFTFEIKGGAEKARKFCESLELFSLLANVADVKSLVIHPASTTHSQMTEEELKAGALRHPPCDSPSGRNISTIFWKIWNKASAPFSNDLTAATLFPYKP